MLVDFRRTPPCSPPTHHHEQHCDCSGVIQVPGHHHLSGPEVGHSHWLVKKAQQRSYFLRQLKKWNLPQAHMTQFYSAVIESVLCSSIWFGSASKSDIRRLLRTVRAEERIIGVHTPSLRDLYNSRVKKWAGNIITDPFHPGHNLFALLPLGRRYRSLSTRTSKHKNISPHAIFSLNS